MEQTLPTDFDALREGDRFVTERRTISEADVDGFAELTGDHHPQHTDAAWAQSSMFGERIAHGLLVFSVAAGLVPFDPERVVALRRVREMVFKRPVLLGEEVFVEGKVRKIVPLEAGFGLVEVGLRVFRGDEQLAMRSVVEVVWRRGEEPLPTDGGGPFA